MCEFHKYCVVISAGERIVGKWQVVRALVHVWVSMGECVCAPSGECKFYSQCGFSV